ncbi:LuxR C-terminal-related transcriptional regulator [Sporomusa sphaeroides]|uniref:Serine/threonine-protein kinase PknK n=1 Tax=Sporomusa sphaeroides DSM 2875 TaxID=1337886 RepID=A0ABM9W217_9FIRM|nr:LuxR C-terminal-related transcriptional regulator [Sporomusa sphaeroides]CVK19230.1 Serine/threonine-protein kinase PknK [Sporomusa sphaeroides DSM 2875]
MTTVKRYNTKKLYFPERITAALGEIFDYPLAAVEAPMGYGKTTAVREYLNKSTAHVLWQMVYDNSLSNFWQAFSNLFSQVDTDCGQKLLFLGFPADSVSLQEALGIIAKTELSARTVLVIDDYHLVETTEIDRFIEFLALNRITNLHIVLIARFIGLQSREELLLKGYLYHIAQETFELTPQEIAGYYKTCGIGLKGSEADELYAVTRGWISALYLLMPEFIATGGCAPEKCIYRLIEQAVYTSLSVEMQEFLLTLCIFDSFTFEQAVHMWGKDNAGELLAELTGKNIFVKYDARTRTYYPHSIFTGFLREVLVCKALHHRHDLYQKAAHWHLKNGEYPVARRYFYECGDFDNILVALEADKAADYIFAARDTELLKSYLEECPQEVKARHHYAMLNYALHLFVHNEMTLFSELCREFIGNIHTDESLDARARESLSGEAELLLSFTAYNDLKRMSAHYRAAWELLGRSSSVCYNRTNWTFGSYSVLYLYYRESGKLEETVRDLRQSLPCYARLTNGHGSGAEYVMEAERYFNTGDFVNAEIVLHKALYHARTGMQTGIIICALFLQIRLAIVQGDSSGIAAGLQQLRTAITGGRRHLFLHTVELCEGYLYAILQQADKIPHWIAEGRVNDSCLLFPAIGAFNMVYGRVLLVRGEYLKLIGSAEYFFDTAAIFPNLLGHIYTYIYLAAANKRICKEAEALSNLRSALDIAMADKLYMPFVENCDYIKPLLKKLAESGFCREDIGKILALCASRQKTVARIVRNHCFRGAPKLTRREQEIACLAAKGMNNREIGERLFISENTVKTQLKSVFEKLGISSRVLLKQRLDSTNCNKLSEFHSPGD